MNNKGFNNTFAYKLIYIFEIQDKQHEGLVKVGDATIYAEDITGLIPNCSALNQAARERINSYTTTANIKYNLLYTEIAVKKFQNNPGERSYKGFRDHDVHAVLKNSGIKPIKVEGIKCREWFKTNLLTAIAAIKAVKDGKENLSGEEISDYPTINLRDEQEEAIKTAQKAFKKTDRVLWNAKMRFGKTLSALELINREDFSKSIIITHRPVVDDSWYEDFNKIFHGNSNFIYGSKNKGNSILKLEKSGKHYVYFASIQDLRGSALVGGNFDKNNEVFGIDWDIVIVDEAHEGTQTVLGDKVIQEVIRKKGEEGVSKLLALSGTPFNIVEKYDEEAVYTWDYVMEQEAKEKYFLLGDSNPYESLPKLNIFTYDLGKLVKGNYINIDDKSFSFKEFFRVNDSGKFKHENDIKSFLNLLTKDSQDSYYPYANKKFRDNFKHTLWMIPGVQEGKALSKLLQEHPIFSQFKIVNVAGDGDDDEKNEEALEAVRNAIKKAGDDGYTITLSCGRLTTGVTVPEWSAVFMLAGSYSTSAANYLQTIFRVQSPCSNFNGGQVKTECYAFDFAPDRTLKMVAEAASISSKAGKSSDKQQLGDLINYCPVIAIDGSEMHEYNVHQFMQSLKEVYAEKTMKSGFSDNNLYNENLLELDAEAFAKFKDLNAIIGKAAGTKVNDHIVISNNGLTEEEREEIERKERKKKPESEMTEEEKEAYELLKQKKKERQTAISILRGISIRLPLLVYGLNVPLDEDITIEGLIDKVDDESWVEFMPKGTSEGAPGGITKDFFKQFIKYYDGDVFIAAAKKIRLEANAADAEDITPSQRVKKIAELFSYFKNPDKETVLTPWRVVNMHMGDCLGGYNFYDESYDNPIDNRDREKKDYIKDEEWLRFINQGDVTKKTLNNPDACILEINSKTGLYPLYVTHSIYMAKLQRLKEESGKEISIGEQKKIRLDTVEKNIFVICKTEMAKYITKRTLVGFGKTKVNAHYMDNLVNMLENKQKQFIERVTTKNFYNNKLQGVMKFDAIVGNPPYQQQDKGTNEDKGVARTSAISIYNKFVECAKKITNQYVSLIIPSRWMTGGKGLDSFRLENMKDTRFSLIHDYENDQEVFPNTDIGGGVMYFLRDNKHDGKLQYNLHHNGTVDISDRFLDTGDGIIIRDYSASKILKKINYEQSFMELVSSRKPFGFGADITKKQPGLFSNSKTPENNVKFYCREGVPTSKYISDKKIKERELLTSYKVFISKTADPPIRFGRANKDILRKPFIGNPYEACSETYLTIGCYKDIYNVESVIKYIKTKFFRFLVLQKKKTQNVSQAVFEFVPLQDFTKDSDINWSNSIEDINKQLYKKYKLSNDDINFIEDNISVMD